MTDSDSTKFHFLKKLSINRNSSTPANKMDENYLKEEQYFLNLFEIGLFEAYEFLYQHCKDEQHLQNWIIELKGESFYHEKVNQFNSWLNNEYNDIEQDLAVVLHDNELNFWDKNGYLHLKNIILTQDCDAAVALICKELKVDLTHSHSWYPNNEKLQGLMLQLYQGEPIEKIRKSSTLFKIFAQLYGTNQLTANTEKVSYNPPETANFKFKGSSLHWDINFEAGVNYYIQGLVYLNDVPINRGAFCLVPGYHKKIDETLKHFTPVDAINQVKDSEKIAYIAGNTGDVILWLQAIPHAASPNYCFCPRFVQYVSFNAHV